MKKQDAIIREIISFIIPYVVLYAIYIQLNGESSPGGGFQAGVIFASAIIAYDLSVKKPILKTYFSTYSLLFISCLGVLLYATTGIVALFFDHTYLDYSILASSQIMGQHVGIFAIEIGVGMTVASVMSLIYFLLQE